MGVSGGGEKGTKGYGVADENKGLFSVVTGEVIVWMNRERLCVLEGLESLVFLSLLFG